MGSHVVRALVVTAHGDRGVLQIQQRQLADPGPAEAQVRVAASGINFVDVYQRQGIYPFPTPFVLGGEGAGEVVAVGSDVSGVAVGDRVAWANVPGSHVEALNIAANALVPVPDEVAADVAAAAMLQGMTAHYLVTSTYPVQSGDSVLVHAAAGGVGQLLVQMAKARGAFVIGTVSTAQKEAVARRLGADQVIRYEGLSSDELAAEVRRRNNDAPVQVVYDGVGQATFDASLATLAPRGMLVLFGASSGQVPPVNPQRLNSGGSLFLTRPTLAHYIATREELLWRGSEVLRAIAEGSLRLDIGGKYSLTNAVQAYDDLESRRTIGKLILQP
jgi:NADPH2:quinone reductase